MSLSKLVLPVVSVVWWELVLETPTSHLDKLVQIILKTSPPLIDNILHTFILLTMIMNLQHACHRVCSHDQPSG